MNIVTVFHVASGAVRHLPEPVGRMLFSAVGTAVGLSNMEGVRQLRRNFERITPAANPVAARLRSARAMRSYMRYYYEAFRLPSLSENQIRARVAVQGRGPLDEALAHGSATGALMHAGNWDLAGAWANLDLAPVHTVAEKLEPPELFEGFLAFREGLGMTIHPLIKGGGTLRALQSDMAESPCFTPLLADRDLTASGIEVELGGHKALVAPGPALLAQRAGVPIFPVYSAYERLSGAHAKAAGTRWGMRLYVADPIYARTSPESPAAERRADLARMSQEWVNALEPYLRAHLEDWHMLQKVFVDDLDPQRLARARAKAQAAGEEA